MSIEEEEDASLKELVTKTLQSNGVLGKIQAQLRASVFLALEDELKEKNIPLVSESVKKLLGTSEGATAAALVHDFLQCLGLEFSLAVFAPESGHSTFWSFPGAEALSSDLSLNTDKGYKTPLLIELLRERQSSSTSHLENITDNRGHHSQTHFLNGAPSHSLPSDSNEFYKIQPESVFSKESTNISMVSTNTGEKSGGLSKDDIHLLTEEEQRAREGKNNDWESFKGLEKHQERQMASAENGAISGNTAALKNPVMMPVEENDQVSNNSITGEEKQYEDDFSSMSEKEGHDDGEEEEDEIEEEDDDIEEAEDIDEDISLDDLINSSASIGSDQTKDQSLSHASDIPNYQEDL